MTESKKKDAVSFEAITVKTSESLFDRPSLMPSGYGLFSSIEGKEETTVESY